MVCPFCWICYIQSCHLQLTVLLLPFRLLAFYFFFFFIAVARASRIFLNIGDTSGIFSLLPNSKGKYSITPFNITLAVSFYVEAFRMFLQSLVSYSLRHTPRWGFPFRIFPTWEWPDVASTGWYLPYQNRKETGKLTPPPQTKQRLCIKAWSYVYKHSVYTDIHRYKLNLLTKHTSITTICSQLLGIFSNYPSKTTILIHSCSCQRLI